MSARRAGAPGTRSRDPLTGLLTPGALAAVMEHALDVSRPAGSPAHLVFVWLEHPLVELRGDEQLLVLLAQMLRDELRGEDTLCRIGNGFLVFAQAAGHHEARLIMRRLRAALRKGEGLAAAGTWGVHGIELGDGCSAAAAIEHVTSPVPGLARAALPHGRRTWLAWLASSRH